MKLGPHAHTPGSEASAEVAEGRGAQVLMPDFASYLGRGKEPLRVLTRSLQQPLEWYEQGVVRAHVSRTIEFTTEALQRALDELDKVNVGKVAVQVEPTATAASA